nr:MAG TPA: hypothetical protein [Caudoviricetes sp.]
MEKKYIIIDLEKFMERYEEVSLRLKAAEMDFKGTAKSNPDELWKGPKSVGVCRAELRAVQDIMTELYGSMYMTRQIELDLEKLK